MLKDADGQSYQDLLTGPCSVPDDARALLFTGSDALEWLQGQVSQDLRGFEVGEVRKACFLAPTGQLRAIVYLHYQTDGILASMPAACVPHVLERVEQTVFMEDVSVSKPFGDARPQTLFGRDAHALTVDKTSIQINSTVGGWQIWGADDLRVMPATQPAWEALRLELGIPKWTVDADDRTLPPELGPAFDRSHVSYDKGCWTGQEVVVRIRSRGHTNRTWVCLRGAKPITAGAEVERNAKVVGKVTSGAISPEFGPLAGAMIRNEALDEPTLTVNGANVRWQHFPLRP